MVIYGENEEKCIFSMKLCCQKKDKLFFRYLFSILNEGSSKYKHQGRCKVVSSSSLPCFE